MRFSHFLLLGASAALGQQTAFISVSVGTLWTTPTSPRPIDAPALSNPVEIQKWVSSLTTADSQGLSGNNLDQTQALLGTFVTILNTTADGKWYEIAASGQPTPKNKAGYPGYIPAVQLAFDETFAALQAHLPSVLVTSKKATLYTDPLLQHPLMEISANTRLPLFSSNSQNVAVALPGSEIGYLAPHQVIQTNRITSPSGSDLVSTAKRFLKVPYLWGGMSAYGFDCSGFTHTIYSLHGITIARDAGQQATFAPYNGRPVARGDLEAGDLIFYATNTTNAATIHHVTMYIGGGEMIEAYESGVPVRIAPVRDDEYWGAVRVLQ